MLNGQRKVKCGYLKRYTNFNNTRQERPKRKVIKRGEGDIKTAFPTHPILNNANHWAGHNAPHISGGGIGDCIVWCNMDCHIVSVLATTEVIPF